MLIIFFAIFVVYCIALEFVNPAKCRANKIGQIISLNSALQRDLISKLVFLNMRLDMLFQISACPRKTDINIAGDELNCV